MCVVRVLPTSLRGASKTNAGWPKWVRNPGPPEIPKKSQFSLNLSPVNPGCTATTPFNISQFMA